MLGIDKHRPLLLLQCNLSTFLFGLEESAISLCILEWIDGCICMLRVRNLDYELFLSIVKESIQRAFRNLNIASVVHRTQHCSEECHRNKKMLLLLNTIPLLCKVWILFAYCTFNTFIRFI